MLKSSLPLFLTLLFALPLQSQSIDFWTSNGGSSDTNGELDGTVIYDQLAGNPYGSFVGEMFLMPEDQSVLAGVTAGAEGISSADSDGIFGNVRGLVGFCIDSETTFTNSSSTSQTSTYQAHTFEAANARYSNEGVDYYLSGGLRRAAYMIDRFYQEAHAGGNLSAAALQVAIWEVLYDLNPDASTGSGNYFVRNNTGDSTARSQADTVIATVNQWYLLAAADDWGGSDYDPNDRVLFWLAPDATSANQSIMTLNPLGSTITAVPEPSIALSFCWGFGVLLSRRNRA